MRNKFLGTGTPGYSPLRKVRTVIEGLAYAVRYDFSVAYKLVLSAIVLLLSILLRDWMDSVFVIAATAFVLSAELFNSAIEALCDFIETRHDEKIKAIKDIAAAAVGVAIFTWFVVLGVECWEMWRAWRG
ncbi:diacylglycerol kinase [Craterilacuibacter sp.]|uniref:diacylglycerol kinase n=1 Tax=Craterilacuibacter sp. TaxID=2870909 RepID=UPI003F2F723E